MNEWGIENGWITSARRVESPNCDDRPADCAVELLVIHGISLPPGEFGGNHICALFCNRLDPQAHPYFAEISHLRVSAHVLIRREGEILQFVPFHRRAWHAGISSFQGRAACNDFAVGIELEGTDTHAYSPEQYRQLAAVTRSLCNHYPGITLDRIVGHSDIAPGRKTDPGPAFDWTGFKQMITPP